jgi:hypothetical protein
MTDILARHTRGIIILQDKNMKMMDYHPTIEIRHRTMKVSLYECRSWKKSKGKYGRFIDKLYRKTEEIIKNYKESSYDTKIIHEIFINYNNSHLLGFNQLMKIQYWLIVKAI